MARSFDVGSSQYLEIDQAVVPNEPFTMAAWAYALDIDNHFSILFLGDKDSGSDYHVLRMRGGTVGDPIGACTNDGAAVWANTSSGFSANTWHHVAGVWSATNSRAAFLDGGSKGTNNTPKTVDGEDRVSIGRTGDSTPLYYHDGYVAEAAFWNVALTDAEIAILAAGFSPLFVRPQNLAAYYPLIRDEDQDRVGGYDLTAYNGPSIAAHPPIIYPAPHHIAHVTAPAGAASSIFADQAIHSLVFGGVTVR